MRVVIFWAMCHHSLGHEKKALLRGSGKNNYAFFTSRQSGDIRTLPGFGVRSSAGETTY